MRPSSGHEPGRGARGIGIPGVRFVRPDGHVVHDRARHEPAGFSGCHDRRLDADVLLHRDVGAEVRSQRLGDEMEEAGAHEARIPGTHAIAPLREVRERRPGKPRLALQVVMHAHEARGATGGGRADGAALEDGDPGAASGEVEGEARALDPGTHDDDVGECLHRRILDSRPTACRPRRTAALPYGDGGTRPRPTPRSECRTVPPRQP